MGLNGGVARQILKAGATLEENNWLEVVAKLPLKAGGGSETGSPLSYEHYRQTWQVSRRTLSICMSSVKRKGLRSFVNNHKRALYEIVKGSCLSMSLLRRYVCPS